MWSGACRATATGSWGSATALSHPATVRCRQLKAQARAVPSRQLRRRVGRGSPPDHTNHAIRVSDRPTKCQRDAHRMRSQRPPRGVEQARALCELIKSVEVGVDAERRALLVHRAPEPEQVGHEQPMCGRELLIRGPEHIARRDQTVQQHHCIAVRSQRSRPQPTERSPVGARRCPSRASHRRPVHGGPQRERTAHQRSGPSARTDRGTSLTAHHAYPIGVRALVPTPRAGSARSLNHDNMS